MIVRERKDDFVMIEQHEHALLSGNLFQQLKKEYLPSEMFLHAIRYAIFNHDYGWIPFDKALFWNDKENSPYTFTNFPTAPKAIMYRYGINKVAEHDLYAALLCSEHYCRFLHGHSTKEALQFIKDEKRRAEQIKSKLENFDEEVFLSHYELVRFFDDLSLYVCLNEPGVMKENEHPFFKHGVTLPVSIGKTLLVHWNEDGHVCINQDIFQQHTFTSTLIQKVIPKKEIASRGIQEAYHCATYENIPITFIHQVN